jgi:DNA-binding SARP family transcriptional activator
MEFRILGSLEVLSEGRALDLGGQKQRTLLAVLLVEANRVVSIDRLIEALWEEEPPETAQKALQVHVSQLRKLLGRERLQTKAPGYLLRAEPDELDLARFQRLQEEGRPREALSIWRGPPLADFSYQRFAQPEISRLEELRLACLEERIEADLVRGRAAELVAELEALVQEHPLRERLRAQLMLALYRSERQADALSSYQDARRELVGELGIEPGKSLRKLHQAILRQDPALEPRAPPKQSWSTFVGREAELGELLEGLEDIFAGRGRLFLLVGEPGIGKSRLADELITHAKERGAQVLIGRCWEAGGAPAYWPWVQSLRSYIRSGDPEALRLQLGGSAAELAQILPELREILPDVETAPLAESEGARFRLFDAAASFLRKVAETRPLVLGFDDLHAADEPSLLLLRYVARELGESRILFVGAYRDIDPTLADPLAAAVADLVRQPVTRRLALAGLVAPDVARLIELTAEVAPAQELVAGIYEETEGNPLFVGEVVRLLAQEGLLAGGRQDVEKLGVPQGVREVIGRRLRRLSEDCARILTLACVLGREFDLVALESMAGIAPGEMLEWLDEAMAARIVSEVPGSPGRLRFAHALIRDALYEELTGARRIALHRLAAEALESLYAADRGPHLAELAHHFFLAAPSGEAGKAAEYARRAGDRALALLAYEEAGRLYALGLDALELAPPPRETTRCDLLLGLGEARARAGKLQAANETFLQAAEHARKLGNGKRLARAALGYSGRFPFSRVGSDPHLVPLLEEAIRGIGEDSADRARLLARLSGALRGDRGTEQRRASLTGEAVEIARRLGDNPTLAYVLETTAVGNPHAYENRDIARELVAIADRIGDLERIVLARFFGFVGSVGLGEIAAAEAELGQMAEAAERLRQPAQRAMVLVARAARSLLLGAFEDAEAFMHEALEVGEHAHPWIEVYVRLQRYVLKREQGRLDGLEEIVKQSSWSRGRIESGRAFSPISTSSLDGNTRPGRCSRRSPATSSRPFPSTRNGCSGSRCSRRSALLSATRSAGGCSMHSSFPGRGKTSTARRR